MQKDMLHRQAPMHIYQSILQLVKPECCIHTYTCTWQAEESRHSFFANVFAICNT